MRPGSTKNREQSRDSEMHQAKKKNWYFGMKAHLGVDGKTRIIHTAVAMAANQALPLTQCEKAVASSLRVKRIQ